MFEREKSMLHLFSSGVLSLWLHAVGIEMQSLDTVAFQAGGAGWLLPPATDGATEATLQQYLQKLSDRGLDATSQGIWMQSPFQPIVDRQGTVPRSAASITKVATTLGALKTWSPSHQFETTISARGTIRNGRLDGDLVIRGGGDPFFVWPEAIALGNALQQMGIRTISGRAIVENDFAMNFESDPQVVADRLAEAFDSQVWSETVKAEHEKMPLGTPTPQITIEGENVRTSGELIPLIRHRSLPLLHLLKEMNVESQNFMAETIASEVGGASVVRAKAASAAGVPPEEIQLVNGSGLSPENRISPRAACAMFAAIDRHLATYDLNIGDVFPVAGLDVGTLEDRTMPRASVVKTGTLWNVSALAGVLPTRDRGLVWFAILNQGGGYIEGFREGQDALLETLQLEWGGQVPLPAAIAPRGTSKDRAKYLGADERNQRLFGG